MFENDKTPGMDPQPEETTRQTPVDPVPEAPAQNTPTGENATPSYQAPLYGMPIPEMPQKPKKNKKVVGWIVALALLYVALLAGLFIYMGTDTLKDNDGTKPGFSQNDKTDGDKKNEPIKENPSEDGNNLIVGEGYDGSALTAAQLYEKNVGSVVFVEANYARGTATGSGFVIDSENGYILTNYHVVEECEDVAVTFVNGDSFTAQIVGGDEINDVAVLKIKAEGLKHVTLGNSENIKIGDDVLVIGNPLGDLTFTLTKGIVSGVDRSINTGEYTIDTFQTDAAINSGNSGGPAFDATGAVIGIVSAKYAATGVEGIGFCIPINDAMKIARDLVDHGFVTGRPNFGITVSDSSGFEYSTDEWGRRVIVETMKGAKIEEVGKGSCAEKAGLKAGDVVTKLDDTKIQTANDLINAKNKRSAGETVNLEVYRDGKIITVSVTLDEYSPN